MPVALRLCAVLLCCLALVPEPAAAVSFTLEQAVERAVQANPRMESGRLMLEHARLNTGAAQSVFWPRAALVGNASRVENLEEVQTYNSDNLTGETSSVGLRVSLSLFAGFAHLNRLQRARLTAEAEEARLRHTRLQLAVNVQLQFIELLRRRDDLNTAREAEKRLQTQLRAAEAFVREGLAPRLNVLQNRTELARARQEIIRARNEVRNAEVLLNAMLGFKPDLPVIYKGDLKALPDAVEADEQQALDAAARNRPDLLLARKSVDAARKDMYAAAGRFLPTVDAVFERMRARRDYESRQYNDYTRDYWSAGLSFSWELFSGGETAFTTLAERKRMQALFKDYEDALSNARTEVVRALLDIAAGRERLAAARFGLDSAGEAYAVADKRYRTRTGTITELLDAQLGLTRADNDMVAALAEFHAARARFFYAVGRENFALE